MDTAYGRRIPTTVPATTPSVTPPTIHIDTTLTPTEIPTVSSIVPPSPYYTPTSLDYLPASDTEPDLSEDPSSNHIPPLLATSPFLSSTDDSSDSDKADTPPSPTHEIPLVEVVPPASQILPAPFGVRRRRVTILSPGQPIPHGRPYRYHPNGPVHMMTTRKRVGPLLTHRLAVRHSVDYSSSDYFTLDASSRDSPSNSSSETPSDSSSDALSDFSSGYSSSDHLSSALPLAAITKRPSHSSLVGPSRKRSRSPTTSVPLSSPIPRALSSVRTDLLPPRKRIRSPEIVTGLEDCSYEGSGRSEGIDARVVVETVAREEVDTSARGTIRVNDDRVTHHVRFHDHIVEILVHRVRVIESIQMDQGHRIVALSQQGTVMSERINELEQDNTSLRDTLDVAIQSVTRLQRREWTMPNIRSGATMTREAVNKLIARRVVEALEARDTARHLEPLVEGGVSRKTKMVMTMKVEMEVEHPQIGSQRNMGLGWYFIDQ
ncbi:hypothetical protein Tco_0576187 [Tanacetum coccineum]